MSLYGLPMVVLMVKLLMLFHPFLSIATKKLIELIKFSSIWAGVNFSLPTATAKQRTFLSWNLTDDLISSILSASGCWWVMTCGYIPILVKVGPNTLGIFLERVSVAKRIWYFLAHFLMSFLSLLNFFKPSKSMQSSPKALASSTCWTSPITQVLILVLQRCPSLMVPENLLSFFGS